MQNNRFVGVAFEKLPLQPFPSDLKLLIFRLLKNDAAQGQMLVVNSAQFVIRMDA
jgi:hypothetical protein